MDDIRIIRKHVKDLTDHEYNTLRNLTMGSSGLMRGVLTRMRDGYLEYPPGLAYIAVLDDTWVGWCLYFTGGKYKGEAWFYVDPAYRRKGIGSKLAQKVGARRMVKPKVEAWDYRSEEFFKANRQYLD